jgi:acyl CoA:acetate/3-ketoacid CoA transferase beta subunit
VVHEAILEISALGIDALKALPPTTWCMWGVGTCPGFTRGSRRSIVICEHPNRRWFKPCKLCAAAVAAKAVIDQRMVLERDDNLNKASYRSVCKFRVGTEMDVKCLLRAYSYRLISIYGPTQTDQDYFHSDIC